MSQTAERLRLLNWAAVLLFVAYGAIYVSTLDFGHLLPRDSKQHVIGRDFLNFWMYGRAAFEPIPNITTCGPTGRRPMLSPARAIRPSFGPMRRA